MKIDLMDVEKFVEVNNIKEVSNPISFNRDNYPTEDGLFSYEIFGRPGSYDRKTTYAYIDLKDYFIQPLVYKNLISLNRKIEECVSGVSYFIINESGELLRSEENQYSGTGINFLYDNWEKLNFKKTNSTMRDERLDFLKAIKKEEAFIRKQIVMPAFYRDINLSESSSGNLKHDPINDMYIRIIRLVKALEENKNSGIDFISNSTKANIQKYIVEIFDSIIGLTKKKNGLFRQAVMGKSTDFSSRNVISAAQFNTVEKYDEMMVDMTHTGVPLATLLNTFSPFIIKWVQDFFSRQFENLKFVPAIEGKGKDTKEVMYEVHPNILDDFSYDEIKKKINLYTKAPSERFETIPVKMKNGKMLHLFYKGYNREFNNPNSKDSTIETRYLTWTDVFYQAAIDVCKDKHVYITRYPLEDYFNIYPSKISVLSTFKTKPQFIEGKYYPNYPVIDPNLPKSKVQGLFIDSLQVFNAYLAGLGGDFDGKIQ